MIVLWIIVGIYLTPILIGLIVRRRNSLKFKTQTLTRIRVIKTTALATKEPLEALTCLMQLKRINQRAPFRFQPEIKLKKFEELLQQYLSSLLVGILLDTAEHPERFESLRSFISFYMNQQYITSYDGLNKRYEYFGKNIAEVAIKNLPADEYNQRVGELVERPVYLDYIWPANGYVPGVLRLQAAEAIKAGDIITAKRILTYVDQIQLSNDEVGVILITALARLVVGDPTTVVEQIPLTEVL